MISLKPFYRTFPHSNSERKDADRFEDDVREMTDEGVPSDAMPTLRNGKHGTPDACDDVPRHDATKPYETKPKGTRHRDRDTIRRMRDDDDDEELEL